MDSTGYQVETKLSHHPNTAINIIILKAFINYYKCGLSLPLLLQVGFSCFLFL